MGFDLYTRLLAQAVRELKGEADPNVLPQDAAYLMPLREAVQINLPIPVYLPADYVGDADLRLRLYRRMANLTRMSEVDDLEAELTDRFGPLPSPATNLIYQLCLKVLALSAGVKSISTGGGRLILHAEGLEKRNRAALQARLGQDVIIGRHQMWLPLPLADGQEKWQVELVTALEVLTEG